MIKILLLKPNTSFISINQKTRYGKKIGYYLGYDSIFKYPFWFVWQAILGAQLVITLVMASIIQKIGPHFSLARWILCSTGLIRYLYPTDMQLKILAGISKEKPKTKKNHKHNSDVKSETFHISRDLDITLETAKVSDLDIIHLRFYQEYQWLVDFALYGAIVYATTEIYQYFIPPTDEMNLSMLWCFLVLGFCLKLLVSLTMQYFRGQESIGERSTCIVTGLSYLLLAMIILIIDENHLELGLEDAYSSFNKNAAIFLSSQGLDSSGPASKLLIKFFIALWCGLLGALFTFPGLRMARMHWDCLKYYKDNKLQQLLLNISFALPFLLVVLWIKPISRDYLTIRVFSGMTAPLMSASAFETIRVIAVVLVVVLRLILMPMYLQAYLNMAYHRLEEQKKEAGRITNKELQKKIAAVFYYLCVVSVQYVAPILICLYFAFMYKTLGGYSWSTFVVPTQECPLSSHIPEPQIDEEASVLESAQKFQLALGNLKSVFNEDVFRGLLGFATWWSCFTLFATTSLGMVYQSYFTKA